MALLIFDIDGTLVDSGEVTVEVIADVFRGFLHLEAPSREAILGTFGMTEAEMWNALMPAATEAERAEGSARYERAIVERLPAFDVAMPDAKAVLAELKERGHILTTASNCDEAYMNAVLDSQGMREFFECPLCLGLVGGRRKADILTRHFERHGKTDAYMIGDRSSDIEAAEAHGIPAIGCRFGFGRSEELQGSWKEIRSLSELLILFP